MKSRADPLEEAADAMGREEYALTKNFTQDLKSPWQSPTRLRMRPTHPVSGRFRRLDAPVYRVATRLARHTYARKPTMPKVTNTSPKQRSGDRSRFCRGQGTRS